MDIKQALGRIANAEDLTSEQMRAIMSALMAGEATQSQIGAFLMGMRLKGESVVEIAAAVAIMREMMVRVEAPENAIDIVGTGGDGGGALNISTPSAMVVAAAGVPVAKHGNRALSSRAGSSQTLEALGVKLDLDPADIARCIADAGVGYMFAPAHHPAMKHVVPARLELGLRTLFNLLGPQANPAGVRHYMLGVYARQWVEPVAASLLANGALKAWVACGSDGLDKITTAGPTFITEVSQGTLRNFEITPEDAGLPRSAPGDLAGGDPHFNAAAIREVLGGKSGPYRHAVLLNSAAALIVAGKVANLRDGVDCAAAMIDSGKASATLARLVAVSNGQ